jgi:hypothetical protein
VFLTVLRSEGMRERGLTIGRIVVLVDGAPLQAETSESLLSFV